MPKLRAGLVIRGATPRATIAATVDAERRGVETVWTTVGGAAPYAVTLYAAVASQTERIILGTSIVPTYPRHPIVLATQALAIDSLAAGRLRLGIGPSHRPTIEGMFGIPMGKPLDHLREYLTILRELLWEGKTDFAGDYYHVHAQLPAGIEPPRIPLPISALRTNAFRLAGEIADGAISWMCPVPYLVGPARTALQEGAAAANRPAPPLIGHAPVAMHTDLAAVRAAARKQLSMYGRLPFYAGMFADAGFPVAPDGTMSDALFDALIVSGDTETVATRLREIHAAGVDELLVLPVVVADKESEEAALIEVLTA